MNLRVLSHYPIMRSIIPLDQSKRSKTLLSRLQHELGFHFSIKNNIVFINPEFTLYQAPLNAPIILPTQLNRLMENLNQIPSKLNNKHMKLAEQLISLHQTKSPYTRYPSYRSAQLQKGIICSICFSFMHPFGEKKIVCEKCGCEEDIELAILRSIDEWRLLFPEEKITLNDIYDWCKIIESKKTIRRILKKYFELIGFGRWTYYK